MKAPKSQIRKTETLKLKPQTHNQEKDSSLNEVPSSGPQIVITAPLQKGL